MDDDTLKFLQDLESHYFASIKDKAVVFHIDGTPPPYVNITLDLSYANIMRYIQRP